MCCANEVGVRQGGHGWGSRRSVPRYWQSRRWAYRACVQGAAHEPKHVHRQILQYEGHYVFHHWAGQLFQCIFRVFGFHLLELLLDVGGAGAVSKNQAR